MTLNAPVKVRYVRPFKVDHLDDPEAVGGGEVDEREAVDRLHADDGDVLGLFCGVVAYGAVVVALDLERGAVVGVDPGVQAVDRGGAGYDQLGGLLFCMEVPPPPRFPAISADTSRFRRFYLRSQPS